MTGEEDGELGGGKSGRGGSTGIETGGSQVRGR